MIIFKASEVVSFTQGSLLLLGAYTIARLSDPLGFCLPRSSASWSRPSRR